MEHKTSEKFKVQIFPVGIEDEDQAKTPKANRLQSLVMPKSPRVSVIDAVQLMPDETKHRALRLE